MQLGLDNKLDKKHQRLAIQNLIYEGKQREKIRKQNEEIAKEHLA
jgi:hypothetical protein